jgi:tRNA (mo5U34)-methyltransferase
MNIVPQLDRRRSERLNSFQRSVMDEAIKNEISRRKWYHRIELGNGIRTPGFPWEAIWNNARHARASIDYAGKAVLDLGSWDGMWAFEAEALGAGLVIATDCMNYWQIPWHQGMNNLLLIREAIFSEVVPLWNVSPYRLRDRLDNALYSHPLLKEGFDIVQHLGILYHLRDPLFSLAQARSIMKDGGTLLLETAVDRSSDSMMMRFNAGESAFYDDFTTWWAPTLPCLSEMLRRSFFEVDQSGIGFYGESAPVCRVAVRATAVPPTNALGERYNLDPAFGHGFGEHLIDRLLPVDETALTSLFDRSFSQQIAKEAAGPGCIQPISE